MADFFDWINPFSKKNPFHQAAFGTDEIRENVSTLRPEQEPLYQQAVNSGLTRGAGGAFGESADYYRDLLSNDSKDYQAFAAPETRNFYENTIPNLSEQFAGGGGGQGSFSSSGFRNAGIQAGTDLSERLGAIRANLRMAGAQGLQNAGQIGLRPYSQNMVTEPGTTGWVAPFVGAAGNAAGVAAGQGLANAWGGNKVGGGNYNGQKMF